jgi:uncharacterized protein (TIRG00374 family)
MRARRSLRLAAIAVGLVVSFVFAYIAVRDVDFERFRQALADSNYAWLVPALAVLGVGVALRAVRWRLLFNPATRPPLGATTRALLIGTFFNNVLPARAGEAIRVFALHRDAGTSRAEALGTAATERTYDVIALLVLLFAALPWLPELTWLRRAAVLAIVVAVGLAVTVLVLARWRERPLRYLLRPLARIPGFSVEQAEHAAANLLAGLAAVRRAEIAVPALALSFVAILVIAFSYWLVMLAFDLGLGFSAGLLVMIATNLAMLIPSSPAALGVFEAATVVALGAYGIDDSRALSYAVVLHAVTFVPFVLIGLVLVHGYGVQAWRDEAARRPA